MANITSIPLPPLSWFLPGVAMGESIATGKQNEKQQRPARAAKQKKSAAAAGQQPASAAPSTPATAGNKAGRSPGDPPPPAKPTAPVVSPPAIRFRAIMQFYGSPAKHAAVLLVERFHPPVGEAPEHWEAVLSTVLEGRFARTLYALWLAMIANINAGFVAPAVCGWRSRAALADLIREITGERILPSSAARYVGDLLKEIDTLLASVSPDQCLILIERKNRLGYRLNPHIDWRMIVPCP